jgi:hypothetical protein
VHHNAHQVRSRVALMYDLPRKAVRSRSREFSLRDPVMAGLAGKFCTQQTQVSTSSGLLVASFLVRSRNWFRTGRSGLCL